MVKYVKRLQRENSVETCEMIWKIDEEDTSDYKRSENTIYKFFH